MKSCAFSRMQLRDRDVMMFLHTADAPAVETWAAAMAEMKASEQHHNGSIEQLCIFAVTDGGAPDANMRSDFSRFLAGRELKVAVVTEHMLARGVVTAISWFNPQIKAFAPKNVVQAVSHVGLPRDHYMALLAELGALQIRTGRIATLAALTENSLQAQA